MTSIIIYTTKEKAEPKKNYSVAYWTLPNLPKRFNQEEDLVFFAYDGHIQGYFQGHTTAFHSGEPIPYNAVKFWGKSWQELEEKIPQKPFQGFKYADIPELTDIIKKLMEE